MLKYSPSLIKPKMLTKLYSRYSHGLVCSLHASAKLVGLFNFRNKDLELKCPVLQFCSNSGLIENTSHTMVL